MLTPTRQRKATAKRSTSPAGSTPTSKKKRPATPAAVSTPVATTPVLPETDTVLDISNAPSPSPSESTQDGKAENRVVPIFKDPNFVHSTKGAVCSKRTRIWKNLKQIVASERSLQWKPEDATYSSIDAPPSFIPAKKYSDITGLPALYTDPMTKIRYATTEEFARIRILPSDLVAGYLTLRRANGPVP